MHFWQWILELVWIPAEGLRISLKRGQRAFGGRSWKKNLSHVSSPSLGRLSQDCVIMCHLLFELDKFSAAFLAYTLLLISEGTSPKKEVNSASEFNAGLLCSWSWPCMWPDFRVKGRTKCRCCDVKSRVRNFLFQKSKLRYQQEICSLFRIFLICTSPCGPIPFSFNGTPRTSIGFSAIILTAPGTFPINLHQRPFSYVGMLPVTAVCPGLGCICRYFWAEYY